MDKGKNTKKTGKEKRAYGRMIPAFFVFALVGVFVVVSVYASGPGSSEDPIALKSYVDERISELEARLGGASGLDGSDLDSGAGSGSGVGAGTSIAARLDELTGRVEALSAENADLRRLLGISDDADSSESGFSEYWQGGGFNTSVFEVYEIKEDQRVLFGAGTEVVIRTGSAAAIIGEYGNMINLSTGEDYGAGDNVAINRLLLSSRNDGRGLRFTADAYVMIKGSFVIR
ncbi:MAG: hypothetical protein FWH55_02450 [Oscillospiraceae bacterium]|nr:hypothetical protein [Oscillospiraceae bacterium]